jgi:hypothetical protein
MGWGALKNGELIAKAEQTFEAMIKCDQNLKYQQNMAGRRLAILVLPINDWPTIRVHSIEISDKVVALKRGDFIELIW